ncbi:hypothetical protein AEYBE204_16290 [Asticcacaulis sp. YBE204]|nr:hypothetical protein AEYBE204_16290 [Asticcacaulis sp. YBE204]
MAPSAEILGAVPVDHVPHNTYEHYAALIDAADIVLAQTISEDYPVVWIRQSSLKALCGDRLLIIPNVYFSGYTPDMGYIHGNGARHIVQGPMADYHLYPVVYAYQQGWAPDRATALFSDDAFFTQTYATAAETSLAELKRREATLEVGIADFIAEHYRERRLFNSMNHPTAYLLSAMADRILDHLGVRHYDMREVTQEDYLSAVVKTPAPAMHRMLELRFNNPPIDRAYDLNPDLTPAFDRIRYYTISELVEAFYAIYDRHCDVIRQFPTGIKL